ncbi:hypothetical protein INR49_022897 [Caranx melampygus]|nr:hypothetical protein INR49_022897 [Caranx melampygus]
MSRCPSFLTAREPTCRRAPPLTTPVSTNHSSAPLMVSEEGAVRSLPLPSGSAGKNETFCGTSCGSLSPGARAVASVRARSVSRCQPALLLSVHVGVLAAERPEQRRHSDGGDVKFYRRGAEGGGGAGGAAGAGGTFSRGVFAV